MATREDSSDAGARGSTLADGRFEIVATLGSGGMGVVYEVLDRQSGERVALKTLRDADPQTIYLLKREFRAFAEIRHPNLVSLYELFAGPRECFYTMELVRGSNALDHIRQNGSGAFDERRLRNAFRQLATGLSALHSVGAVHRDVKPSNTLVDGRGRLVLLDFGLMARPDLLHPDTLAGQLVGTVAYIAPEQARGDAAPNPAADWYSLGVLLYEALTGQVPFSGPPLMVLVDKQRITPPPPRALIPDLPADLDELCVALIEREPERRPTGDEVLRRLGIGIGSEAPAITSTLGSVDSIFTGRDREMSVLQAELGAAIDEGARICVVRGPSGIGKSALVREFFRRALMETPHLTVLEGRCYERETIPFKAMDTLVDHLSHAWRRLPDDEAVLIRPRDASLLPTLFPVLGRVRAVADAPLVATTTDPQELRTHAFHALRELFQRLADARPVVLFLDDMQWVDENTVKLLAEMMRPPDPPALLLLLGTRPVEAGEKRGNVGELLRQAAVATTTIELDPLSRDSSMALARRLLGEHLAAQAERVADEAAGNPFFVCELAQFIRLVGAEGGADVSLDDVVIRHVDQLPGTARELLEAIALAGEPIPRRVALSSLGRGASTQNRELGALQSARLIKSSGGADADLVETYHDRIRDAVLGRLSAVHRRELFRALALAYEECGEGEGEPLARCWLGCGDAARAVTHALRGADVASAAVDFDRAAALFRLALEVGDFGMSERRRVTARLADSLGNAGRPAEAAEAYLAAAVGADKMDALRLRQSAAEQLMRGGYLTEGLDAVEPVCRELGVHLAPTPGRALVSLLVRRARLRLWRGRYRMRDRGDIAGRELGRVDLMCSIAIGLNFGDYIRGAEMQARHLLLALSLGEPTRVARALAYEAAFLASQGAGARAAKMVALARDAAGDEPYALAFASWSEAAIAYYVTNRWRESLRLFDGAERQFREQSAGGFEIDMARLFACWNRMYLGELGELAATVPSYMREAERRGDLYGAVNLRTRVNLPWLIRDDPDGAAADVAHALDAEMPDTQSYLSQHFFAFHSRTEISLYRGDGARALEQVSAELPRLGKSLLLRMPMVRLELLSLEARALLAAAASAEQDGRERLLRRVRACVRTLRRIRVPLAAALATAAEAGLATFADSGAAVDALREAARQFDELETHLHAHAFRWRLGEATGGDEGDAILTGAEHWMREQGIVRPRAIVQMLAPATRSS